MNRRDFCAAVAGTILTSTACASGRSTVTWNAGAAAVDITPEGSLWMAGFARRRQPAQGVALPLHAKALALQAGRQAAAVLVTADLLGLTARITDRVAAEVLRRHAILRSHILFNASHTHCGPVVEEQLSVAYELSPDQWRAIRAYTAQLEEKLLAVIGEALSRLGPARVKYARGEANFARNRRVKFTPDGPVDHAVPVLRVDDADGSPLAIVFGYACHNTTLQDGFMEYHGDYAGVAQAMLEERYPGATALFVSGCGADANPYPRGTLDLVQAHGTALADAVDLVHPAAAPIGPALHAAYSTVDLPFADPEVRERWKAQLDVEEVYLRRHAALMEAAIAREGHLPSAQRAPVQVWGFGPAALARGGRGGYGGTGPAPRTEAGSPGPGAGTELTLVALGGEVVVDYAFRLAREYPERRIWAAGYSNDVFGYVPSRRVLREGG